jgi:hypothetical protein
MTFPPGRRDSGRKFGKGPKERCCFSRRIAFELLEDRRMLSVSWDGGGGDNLWSNPLNWSGDARPGANDDVTINAAPGVTITHDVSSDDSIKSLTSTSPISLSGGTLDVLNTVSLSADLLFAGGTMKDATVTASSTAHLIVVSGSAYAGTWDNVTLEGDLTLGGLFNDYVFVRDGLTLSNGATLSLIGSQADLQFQGTQTLGGTGTVTFATDLVRYAAIYVVGGDSEATAATLTIGSNITIRTVGPQGGTSGVLIAFYSPYDTIDNRGVIETDGRDFDIDNAFINNGTVSAVNGGNLRIFGTATNNGDLKATNGGNIEVSVSLTNSNLISIDSGSTLYFDNNGVLAGGTLAIDNAAQILGNGTLDHVTLAGTLLVPGTELFIKDGLTLSGGATISLNDSAHLTFQGTQSLSGIGTVAFGGAGLSSLQARGGGDQATAATLTIGPGITIHSAGADGEVAGTNLDFDTIDNQGLIDADVVGKTFDIAIVNNGVVLVEGGILTTQGSGVIGGTVRGQNGGQISSGTFTDVTLEGDLTLTGTTLNIKNGLALSNNATVSLNDNAFLVFQGTQTLEGTGTVAFGGTSTSYLYAEGGGSQATAATLTIGPGITVHSAGADGWVSGFNSPYDTIDNQGMIEADAVGKRLTVDAVNGSGTLLVDGGTLFVNGTVGGTVKVQNGGQITSGTLDNVTLEGDLTLTGDSLFVKDGLTLSNNTTVSLNDGAELFFQGTQALGGTGTVSFGGNSTSYMYAQGSDGQATAATLTIGSGITIHSAGADGWVIGYYASYGELIDNQGTIRADAAGIVINGINNGTLEALNGGTLHIVGPFNDPFNNNTSVSIDNTSTLYLQGILKGGNLTDHSTAPIDGLTPTLDGVTLSGNLLVSGGELFVQDGLTLSNNATVSLDDGAELFFQGTQELGGRGAVAFGGTGTSYLFAQGGGDQATSATLTIGRGIAIQPPGSSQHVSGYYLPYDSIVGLGTVEIPLDDSAADSETKKTETATASVNQNANVSAVPSAERESLLLLQHLQPVPTSITLAAFEAAGAIISTGQVSTSGSSAQVIDAVFTSGEANEIALLGNFLDSVDPEMVVVDLGDEPPAQLAGDAPKSTAPHKSIPQDKVAAANSIEQSNTGSPTKALSSSVTVMKPQLDAAAETPNTGGGSALPTVVTSIWKWFASIAAVLLLGGAAWKGRNKWTQIARNLRWR